MKFNKRAWQILRGYLDGHKGEIHSLVKGHKTERLSTLILLSVENHRGKTPAKNWLSEELVPIEEKNKCLAFWASILSNEDWGYFSRNNLV